MNRRSVRAMNRTSIEWTDLSWNPLRGCSRVSPGCTSCYAERIAARFSGMDSHRDRKPNWPGPFAGIARTTPDGPRWTGKVELVEAKLTEPLRRSRWAEKFLREHGRKPRVFLCDMSDLFYEAVPDEWIDRVFAVMALTPEYEFFALTKRVKRMRAYIAEMAKSSKRIETAARSVGFALRWEGISLCPWPLPHVRLGASAEDQERFDERIGPLMQLAVQGWKTFVSFEPLLSEITVSAEQWRAIGWVILGGESGPSARPCEIDWIRSLRHQAKAASVPCFIKQVGSRPDGWWTNENGPRFNRHAILHPKGSDPFEWPEDLRVREWPSG